MSQNVNLQVAGIYTAPSDLAGIPQGALEAATNVENRYKNVIEPRRGFEGLPTSDLFPDQLIRLTNFPVLGTDRVISLDSDSNLWYYNAATPIWVALPGINSGVDESDPLAKCRFTKGAQNLYITGSEGILSMASGSGSEMIRAGVPVGLNLTATAGTETDGFFGNNVVLNTEGDITSASALISNLLSSTGIEVDQYVAASIQATLTVQNIVYISKLYGTAGNAITIEYENNGSSLPLTVTVVGTAITVQLATNGGGTPTSTASAIIAAIEADADADTLVSMTTASGATVQAVAATTALANGADTAFPTGTKVSSITPSATVITQTASLTAGSTTITALASSAGIVAGLVVTGTGIPDDTEVVSISGAGPYSVVLSNNAYQTATGVTVTFDSKVAVTLTENATVTAASTLTNISFFSGSQVAYRMLFGRTETDNDGNTVTRLGAPSSMAVATNITGYSVNVSVVGTLPKNAENDITFVQLYRSLQTAGATIQPVDQMQLVYERELVAGDFTARTVTVADETTDDLLGLALYTGTDQEGILQSNLPPPAAWDMTVFRDFALFGNTTQPSTLSFTILSVGSPSGIQVNDTITITQSDATSSVYTAKATENAAAKEFKVFSAGTPSQNIADTAKSLISVINYDESLSVHALYVSSETDLPGKVTLQRDYPFGTFTITASAHTTAYDPTLSAVASEVDRGVNAIYVSKAGKLESVPGANVYYAGDSSTPIYRVIALRDYAFVLKADGIYKVIGTAPENLRVLPFDLTTQLIAPDSAVSFNSGVWMLSDQGIVSVSDAGVSAISTPIDDQINVAIGSYFDNVNENGFAVGYESDRKYILCLPENAVDNFSTIQYGFNYVTNAFTTWDRLLSAAFIHTGENKMYIGRSDPENYSMSKERKTGTYTDYVDEAISGTITAVASTTSVTLASVDNVEVGDILYQASDILSPITAVDLETGEVTTQFVMSWVTGAVSILKAIDCTITWKQVFGDNPAFTRQYSEGLVLFKNTRFNTATMTFSTDFSQGLDEVELSSALLGSWGLFPWGETTWGGTSAPSNIRFYIPQDKQFGSYIIPSINIKQGYSNFKLQGLSITFNNISGEVGK